MTTSRTPEQRARHWASWQIALRTGVAGLAFVTAQTAFANPNGGNVVAGNATINGQGTDRVRIDQSSDRVIINWDNFSIGAGQGVDFRQPNARSIALNRVTGPEISQIMGELTANGQIYLINGNGIVFGKDARVDVAGLVATSADIANDAFMAGGSLRFGTPGRSGAKVINHGTITVRDAGIAAFVAPQVANDGIITAHMGRIAFGGAQAFTLDLHGDNLIRFQVGDAVTRLDDKGALVDIGGVVDARGGSLLITASAARDLVNQSVRVGTPQAASMQVGADGKVSLVAAKMTITAPGEVQVGSNVAMDLSSGTNAAVAGGRPAKGGANNNIGWATVVDGDISTAAGAAMATSGTGGTLTITAARTILDGTINLDGNKAGGTAHITGTDFLSFGSILSASGAEAGGNIQLDAGGFSLAGRITVNAGLGKGGSVDIHTTRRAIDTGDAFIDASGLHGGAIRYTSDQQIISSGKFRASGSHGFGGSIDVSAPRLDLFSAQFYAQGGIRGGRVRLGGEFQGGKTLSVDELINARTLVATDAVTVDVSAVGMRGNAGEIVIWSDEKTTFLGTAIARGGLVGGTGGQIEISGKETLVYRGTVETARDGQRGGKLLLDPKNIIIADVSNAPSQYGLVLQAFASSFPGPVAAQPGLQDGDLFGTSVSLDGNRLAVGAPGDDGADGALTDVGAVYLFTFGDSSFTAPVLSAVVGSGYTGGRNLSIGNLETDDQFGSAVSLVGTRLAVGAPGDDGGSNSAPDSGAVYLFSFLDLEFNASATLGVLGVGYGGAASLDVANLESGDLFGSSLSVNGNRIVVGAPGDAGDGNSNFLSGAVYLFTFSDDAFNDPVLEGIMGSGYTGGKNVSVALGNDSFGSAVALSGFGLAIGAINDDGLGDTGSDNGAVYLYSFSSADFTTATLQSILGTGYSGPNDFDVVDLDPGDRFGASLGLIGGESLAILADSDDGVANTAPDSGAVYLFNFTDAFFEGPTLSARIGANYDSFGGRNRSLAGLDAGETISSLALDFNGLVLGVTNDTGRAGDLSDVGAAFLFTFDDTAFNNGRQAGTLGSGYSDFAGLSLLGSGLDSFDAFGTSVSLQGNQLAVGVVGDDGASNVLGDVGAVYLFTFGDALFSAPVLQGIIGSGYSGGKNVSVPQLEAFDNFGQSVSLDGTRLAVGATGDDGSDNLATDAGAVYLFSFGDAAFSGGELRRVLNFESISGGSINANFSYLGSAVSLQGPIIAVGAAGDAGFGGGTQDAGAVHIFNLADPMFTATPERLVTIGLNYEFGNDVNMIDLGGGDQFGAAVSLDGLNLAVGAPGDDGFSGSVEDVGAAFLFSFADVDYSGGSLLATIGSGYASGLDFDPGIDISDAFGRSLALQGLQLVVGATGDDGEIDAVSDAGAVYLFTFGGSGFSSTTLAAIIGADYAGNIDYALDLSFGEQFGVAVALDNDRLVVGSFSNPGRNDSLPGAGAVHLFTFEGAGFAGARLVDTLGAGYSGQSGLSVARLSAVDRFGTSVSLDGTRLAVGAPGDGGAMDNDVAVGAVYLFSFADLAFGAPVLEAIVGVDYTGGKNVAIASLETSDLFGSAVSLAGLQLAVGAPGDEGQGNSSGFATGAVYLLSFGDLLFGGGALEATLGVGYSGGKDLDLSVNITNQDQFGRGVSLVNNRLAVGAPGDSGASGTVSESGAVFLFTFDDAVFNGGVLRSTVGAGYSGPNDIDATQLEADDQFGFSVALNRTNNRLFVGTPGDDGESNGVDDAGAVYRFDFADALFSGGSLESTLGAGYFNGSDTGVVGIEAFDAFGYSVAVDGGQLAIGAVVDGGFNDPLEGTGAVYLFEADDGGYAQRGIIGAGYGANVGFPVGALQQDDVFGTAVSLNQNRLAVGAPGDDGVANTIADSGAVYLFSFTSNGFAGLTLAGTIGQGFGAPKNLDLLGDPGDNIGAAVSLSGNQLVIGVPGAPDLAGIGGDPGTMFGAVYLFTFADATFSGPTLTGVIGQGYSGAGNFDVAVLEDGDMFGAAVALDGLRLAIGAPGDDGANDDTGNAGAVYLFSFANTSFASPVLEARVGRDYSGFKNVSVGDLDLGDTFGAGVSLRGTQLAVGVPGDDGQGNNVTNTGAAYLFTFTNSIFNGGERAGSIGDGYNILAADFSLTLETGDRFGSAVSLGTLGLAVGASGDDGSNNDAESAGAVYLFNFADTSFASISLASTLGRDYIGGSNDMSIFGVDAFDEFGSAVSLDGTMLAVGSRGDRGVLEGRPDAGAVYLLNFGDIDFSTPLLRGIVGAGYSASSSNLSITGLATGDLFGSSVALDAGRLVVGAPGDDGVTADRFGIGKVYLFTFTDSVFSGLAFAGAIGSGYVNGPTLSLTANGIAPEERFGSAVALDGLRLAIGATDDSGASNLVPLSGAVYLFTFGDLAFGAPVLESVIGSGYSGGKNLSVANLDMDDLFGGAVALDGNVLAVGAIGDDGFADDEVDAGAVYLFSFADAMFGSPVLEATIGRQYGGGLNLDPGNTSGDFFGRSLALDGQRLAIGAPGDDGSESDVFESGAVYLFTLAGTFPSAITRVGKIGFGYTLPGDFDVTALEAGDEFGTSVGLDGRALAVGAQFDDGGTPSSFFDLGAVYTFAFADDQFGGGTLQSTIGYGYTGPNDIDLSQLSSGDYFGSSLSLNGGRLAVGATQDDGAFSDTTAAGAVYLISFGDVQFGTPVLEATIGRDYFGDKNLSAPLDGFDLFGSSVALDGNRLAVGAIFDDGPGNAASDTGGVYLFTFADAAFGGGLLKGALGAGYGSTAGLDLTAAVPPTFVQVGSDDAFGYAVSLDGNRLAIGAFGDDGSIDGLANAGAVYLFTFDDADFAGATLQSVIGHGYIGGKNIFVTQVDSGDGFGGAVSLNGNRLAVGARSDDGVSNSVTDAGAVYLFSFTDAAFGNGALEGIVGFDYSGGKNIAASGLDAGDEFGFSVALDGNRLAVGARYDDGQGESVPTAGAVYLFSFADLAFSTGILQAKIGAGYTGGNNLSLALDGDDQFGYAVSLDGNRLAVGAAGDDAAGNAISNSGAVYLFTFSSAEFAGGVQEAVIGSGYSGGKNIPVGSLASDLFGAAVSLDGNRLAVGAIEDDGEGDAFAESGAAYLFTFTNADFSGGLLEAVIGSGYSGGKNIDLTGLSGADQLGVGLSLDANRLVIGATGDDGFQGIAANSGAVYLLTFADAEFNGAQLRGNIGAGYTRGLSTAVPGVQEADAFGWAVSLEGNRLAVGSPQDQGAGGTGFAGAVYLFTFASADFEAPVLQGILGEGYTGGNNLSVPGLATSGFFGGAVSLDGNRLAVGASSTGGSGAVYLFTFADAAFSTPQLVSRIAAGADGPNDLSVAVEGGDFFGYSVALDGDRLAVGAPGDDGAGNAFTSPGAVYLFSFADSLLNNPAQEAVIGSGYSGGKNVNLSVLDAGDGFGISVGLQDLRLVVGAEQDDGFGSVRTDSGAVYLFAMSAADFSSITSVGTIGVGYTGIGDLDISRLDTGDWFGRSISLDGNRLAVGAVNDAGATEMLPSSGAVYVIGFADAAFGTPSLVSIFGQGYSGPNDVAVGSLDTVDFFGNGVSIDGGRLVIGTPFDDGPDNLLLTSGAVYFFSLTGGAGESSAFGFDDNPGADVTISASTLVDILSGGTGVTLQANNDITVNAAILVDNPSGNGGNLFLDAGRSILLNAGITSDNGGVYFSANFGTDPGIVDAQRDPGGAVITFGPGGFIDAGTGLVDLRIFPGVNQTNFARGAMTLGTITAGTIIAINGDNSGPLNGEVILLPGAVLTASDAADAITISGSVFTNNAGAGVFNLTGGGRFRVYSADYDAIDRGGVAGNNLYNRTLADSITQPGNLFIFSRQPILTFTADDATRTYGEGSPSYTFQFSGLVNGDSAGYAFSGAPDLFDSASGGAGTDTISIQLGSLMSDVGYGFDFIDGTLTTLRALLTVTADDATRTYGDFNPMFTASFSGFVNGDDASVISGLNFTTLADEFSDAGTYSITPFEAFADNYDFDYVPGTLTITKALLTVTADDATREYGLANPAFTGSITGFRNSDDDSVISGLVYGSIADITSNAGVYDILGSGASATNYDFDYIPGTLTITKALLTVTADDATREYGLANPAFTGSITGFRNSDDASVISGLTYDTTALMTSNVGLYTIIGGGATATNYDFTYAPGTLTITRALLTVTADDASREYGLANPTLTGAITGFRNSDTASVVSGLVYGTVATTASNVGTYAITGSGASATNYDFSYIDGSLTITKALLTVTADDATREYGLANPAFTGSITGFRNSDTASVVSGLVYNTVADITSNAGTYGIVGAFATATNYDFAYVPGTLTITKALLTVTADDATREYGLTNPAFTGSITGFRNSDTASVISGLVYGSSAVLNSGIGTYSLTGSGATSTNYDFSYVPGTLTITRALLTVSANDASREYGLANPAFTGSISGLRAGDTTSVVSGLVYGTLADSFSNSGSYAITASGGAAANYNFSYVDGALTITKALLTVTADDAAREYGLANPAFTGSITGFRNSDTASVVSGLVYNTVADITSNAGTYGIVGAFATATNYDFAYVPGTLTITKALLTVTADDATREYGLADPVFTGSITGFRNSDTASVISGLVYGSSAVLNSGIGTYSLTGGGATSTNYDFSYVPGTLTITRALLTVTANDASREYGLANPTFTGSISGLRAGDTASVVSGLVYGTVADSFSNAGSYAITGSGGAAANYDFSYVDGALTITKALLTVTADDAAREYGLANPAFTGSITGFRNSDTASVVSGLVYNTVADITSNAGTYGIVGAFATATNYDFAYAPGTLTITKALLTVTADDASREYGLADPVFTGSIAGFRNSDTASVISGLVYGSSAVLNSGIGTYSIIGSGATSTNYDFSYVPGTLTITRALLTVTANDASREYGLANPAFTGSISGLRAGDTTSVVSGLVYGTLADSFSNAGSYAITASGGAAANYDFNYVDGTLTITKALLTVTADDAAREYGLANPAFTGSITGFRNSDTASVVSGLVYNTVADITSNAGTYGIVGAFATATNYDFAYAPGTLAITKALLTVTADNATREYGLTNPAFTGSITGLRNSDTASVISGLVYGAVATAASDVGTYAITGSGASATNYDFSYVPGALTITRALLTVTANNATREYGLANPTFTGSITGLRNADTVSVISGLVYGSAATPGSNVGTFAITGSGASATNYNFAYVPGTLTITKALLTVTADNATREYGLANPAFTGSITGFRNSDTASVVSGLVYNTVADITSNAGTYGIVGAFAAATNYDFAYIPGTLTITKALLTVTADDASREYGLVDPVFTGSITGFRNSDTASVISGLVYGSSAVLNSGIGTHSITGSGATSTNYDFSYVPGTLTITRALLTVTANDASREYGLANPTFTGSISGLRAGDTASVVSGLVYGSAATVASNVGTFAITGSGGAAANYNFAYVPGTLTITKALLTVTADDAAREYGLANPAFTGSIAGFRNSDTASVVSGLAFGTVATGASNVGSYAITGSGGVAANYDFAYVPGTLTITRALLTVTADDATREYGLTNPAFTGSISGLRNADSASVISGLVYGSAATTASNVGTFAITGSGATAINYDFAYVPGTLTITKALLTVTANDATREYGLANPTFTGSITGLRAGDTASVVSGLVYGTVASNLSNVGTYSVTGSGGAAANYDFAYVPGTLTITRALLTVTADDATREYGLGNPTLTGSIAGLRNGDTASVITGLAYGTVATVSSNVGSYAITGSGGSATNYDFAYVAGTLTITKALLTISADNTSREYGLANPALTSTVSGLRNGDTASVVSGLMLATSATQASGVGSYAIGVSGGSALNYDFAYVPGTLAVTPAPLTVTIDNKTRVYGGANPELTASITGFRNGDSDAQVSGLRLRTGAIARTNVGDYLITGSGAVAANYRFDYLPGTLTITKALLQVRVNNASREYGLANPQFSAIITGFRNGDRDNVVSGLVFGTPATIGSDVGSYAITASGASALNYDFVYTPGRLSIDQARLLITANNLVLHQGSGDPLLTVSYSGLRNGDTADVVTGLVLRSSGGGTALPGQYIINAARGSARNYQITYRPGVMTVLPATPPPAQDPPAIGGDPSPPAASPPVSGPPASPPPVTPPNVITPPPADTPPVGGAAPVASPPVTGAVADTSASPAGVAAPPAPAPSPGTSGPTPITAMPAQGTVSVPVPSESLSPMQVLQGLSAPLPVLVAPETRPADAAPAGDPSRGDGQRTGCAYISLCSGAPQPLWTFQPAQ